MVPKRPMHPVDEPEQRPVEAEPVVKDVAELGQGTAPSMSEIGKPGGEQANGTAGKRYTKEPALAREHGNRADADRNLQERQPVHVFLAGNAESGTQVVRLGRGILEFVGLGLDLLLLLLVSGDLVGERR